MGDSKSWLVSNKSDKHITNLHAHAHAQTNLIVYFDRKLLWKGNFDYIF